MIISYILHIFCYPILSFLSNTIAIQEVLDSLNLRSTGREWNWQVDVTHQQVKKLHLICNAWCTFLQRSPLIIPISLTGQEIKKPRITKNKIETWHHGIAKGKIIKWCWQERAKNFQNSQLVPIYRYRSFIAIQKKWFWIVHVPGWISPLNSCLYFVVQK